MTASRIGRRGQVTLPAALRRQLGLQEGDPITISRHGEDLLVRPIRKTLLQLRGSVAVTEPQDFDAIRRKVREAHAGMLDRGLRRICTFDRRHFARLPGLTVIVPGEDPA